MAGKKYKVRCALYEDIHTGGVWTSEQSFDNRSVVKIINFDNNKAVYCEHMRIDDNFIRRYNDSKNTLKISLGMDFFIASEWYRDKLGIVKNSSPRLKIKIYCDSWCCIPSYLARLDACLDHPQLVVRLSTHLAMLGVLLGVVGVFF